MVSMLENNTESELAIAAPCKHVNVNKSMVTLF